MSRNLYRTFVLTTMKPKAAEYCSVIRFVASADRMKSVRKDSRHAFECATATDSTFATSICADMLPTFANNPHENYFSPGTLSPKLTHSFKGG